VGIGNLPPERDRHGPLSDNPLFGHNRQSLAGTTSTGKS
jgi:hypothetical protein